MKTKQIQETRSSTAAAISLASLFSILLALTLFAAGLFICTLQPTTELLSRMFSNFDQCAYLPEETVKLAVATRDFTIEAYGNKQTAHTAQLAHKVLDSAKASAASNSPKSSLWKDLEIPPAEQATQGMYRLAEQGAQFALGKNEIKHLVDCNRLINSALPILIIIAIAAIVIGIIVATRYHIYHIARALIAGPLLLLLALLGIAIWGIIDFNSFFGFFHESLFPQGNWTFPADSLLICMLPTSFWIAMLFVWIVVSMGLSALCIGLGHHLLRR